MVRREEIADLGFFSKLPGKATPVGYLFLRDGSDQRPLEPPFEHVVS
jgi:hypothetical protein